MSTSTPARGASLGSLAATVILMLLAILLLAQPARAAQGSEGKEFYMTFQPNFGGADDLSVIIAAKSATTGVVEIPSMNFRKTFTVAANQITTVAVPNELIYEPGNAVGKRVVHVIAEDNIAVYGMNRRGATTDGYLALPVEALGTEYYAVSYNSYDHAYVSIIGAFDNTKVTITPSIDAGGYPAGTPFVITINKGESYKLVQRGDLSGTHISASAPIGVITSADAAHIPVGYGYLDHINEMMPPVSTWGKKFLTVPLATRLRGDLFRIMASQDGTTIKVNGKLVATLQKGKFYETILTTRSEFEASAPALLTQFAVGTDYDGVDGDPFAMTIVPTEQFLDQYTVSTPAASLGFTRQYVNVVIPTGAVRELMVDGVAVDSNKFSPIGTSGFSGGQVPLLPGSQTLTTRNAVPFGIYIYGFGWHDSYGYPGGMSFKAINPAGDPYAPALRMVAGQTTFQGSATDSEDTDANGVLGAGEDLDGNGKIDLRTEDANRNGKLDTGEDGNGNKILDRDSGVFKVELLAGATNLKLTVLPFVPGAPAVNFSITRVDATRPGTGVVHVEDGAGNVAEAPVEIGGVAVLKEVRAVITLSTVGVEVDMGSFKKQPYSVTGALGKQMIEWRFDEFKADSMADLSFDVSMINPVGGETRVISHQVDLYYKDANGKELHTALDARSVGVLPGNYVIVPSTDKASYIAGEAIRINSAVRNVSTASGTYGVRLALRDTRGGASSVLGMLPLQRLDAGAVLNYDGIDLAAANVQVGTYILTADLVDGAGATVASGQASFAVTEAPGVSVSAAVASDKPRYSVTETAVLTARVASLRVNQSLDGLKATTVVRNADNSIRMSKTETLVQLAAGAGREFRYSVALAGAQSGQQDVTLTITAPDGKQLAVATTAYAVSATADTGAGLTGSVAVSPKQVNSGDSLAIIVSVTNSGNTSLEALPIAVTIIDPVTKATVAEFPYTQTLAQGGTFSTAVNWLAGGTIGRSYVAIVTARVGGKSLTLGQDVFMLVEPAVKLDITQSVTSTSRVLGLVSCNSGEADTDARGKPAACISERARIMEQALRTAGASYLVATDMGTFKAALRSGRYNTYWLSGKQDKLPATLAIEIREAAFRGDGLLMDSEHDQRNKILDAAFSVRWAGKIGEINLPVAVSGASLPRQTLRAAGRGLKGSVIEATVQANFAGGKPNAGGPAIVSHVYGAGRTMLYAFDLPASLRADQAWQPNFQAALQHVLAGPATAYGPGSVVPLNTRITNVARAADVSVSSVIPAGATYLSSRPAGSFDAGPRTVSWSFPLAEKAVHDLQMMVQLGEAPEAANVVTNVATVKNGVVTPYGSPLSLTLERSDAAQTPAAVLESLAAIGLSHRRDQTVRARLVEQFKAAAQDLNAETRADQEEGIAALVGVIDLLSEQTWPEAAAVRLHLDALLRDAQRHWSALPAAQ